jgi:hypothetical protein
VLFANQHDLDITSSDANTGLTFRSEVNSALQALGTLQSGATTPSKTYANMFWADTGNMLLKMRNTTNSAWITVGKLDIVFLSLLSTYSAQTVTAVHTFNPASAGPPWILGANAIGQKVSGLNAGLLNGSAASASPADSVIPIAGTDGRLAYGFKPALRGCLLRLTASQSISNATSTTIAFDTGTESYDTDAIHDITTNNSRLTVPAGVTKVRLQAQSAWQSNSSGRREVRILKNGVSTAAGLPLSAKDAGTAGNDNTNISSAVITVVSGDYFELEVWQDSGTALNFGYVSSSEFGWFSMETVQ